MSFSTIFDILPAHFPETEISDAEYQRMKVNRYNQSHGNLDEIDGYNCDICKNKGFIAHLDEYDNEETILCKCRKIRSVLSKAKKSGLGNVLTDCTFDKYVTNQSWQTEIKNKAVSFCENEAAKWFFIGGQSGSGKSHLCTAICGYYIKSGQDVKYMIWVEESKKLKAIVNTEGYSERIQEYKDVDVLYIDDFLKVQQNEAPTAGDIKLAFEIINHRIIADKITIISSEKTLDEILDYDEATMSRVYQKTGEYKINIRKDRDKNYRLRS